MIDISLLRWLIGSILIVLLLMRLFLASLVYKKEIRIYSVLKLAKNCSDPQIKSLARVVFISSITAYVAIGLFIILYKFGYVQVGM